MAEATEQAPAISYSKRQGDARSFGRAGLCQTIKLGRFAFLIPSSFSFHPWPPPFMSKSNADLEELCSSRQWVKATVWSNSWTLRFKALIKSLSPQILVFKILWGTSSVQPTAHVPASRSLDASNQRRDAGQRAVVMTRTTGFIPQLRKRNHSIQESMVERRSAWHSGYANHLKPSALAFLVIDPCQVIWPPCSHFLKWVMRMIILTLYRLLWRLDKHFSNWIVHANHLGILLQYRFWFRSSGTGPEVLHF